MKVTVKRSEWLRGEGVFTSSLFRVDDKKRCCVGFACNAAGLTDDEIAGHATVDTLPTRAHLRIPSVWIDGGVDRFGDLYEINDDKDITDARRERQLINYGKQVGIEFEFVD